MERRIRLFRGVETGSNFFEKRAAEVFGPAARTYLQALAPPDIGDQDLSVSGRLNSSSRKTKDW
jgi:hypothetical protein